MSILSQVKYPKSLTILINTRIRGFSKIKYEPNMSVPGIRSETIYFDPLVKLNSLVAGSIPKGYPPSELYTQFFNKGSFESLLNRTLSNSGQTKKTLEQATQEGNVNNNIKVTLNQLFKKGRIFYIKGQPYTINGYDWASNDWIIGTKSIEQRFEITSNYGEGIYSMVKQNSISKEEDKIAEQEYQKFISKYPTYVIRGNSANSKFSDNELLLNDLASGNSKELQLNQFTINSDVTTNPNKTKDLPQNMKLLVSTELIFDSAINSDPNTSNLASDPISKSILNALNTIYKEEVGKNPKLKERYEMFHNSSVKYFNASENFKILTGIQDDSKDETTDSEQIRTNLLENKDKIIELLYEQVSKTKQLNNQVIDRTISIINEPQENPDTLDPNLTAQNTNIQNLEKTKSEILSVITPLEKILNSNTQNTDELLQQQMNIFTNIQNMDKFVEKFKNIIRTLNTIYARDLIQQANMMRIKLHLQQIKQLFQKYIKIANDLISKFNKENYNFIVPEVKGQSIMIIKNNYDKLADGLIKLIDKYKRDGTPLANFYNDANVEAKKRIFTILDKLISLKKAYLIAFVNCLGMFLQKINSRNDYIKEFSSYIKFLSNIQMEKLFKVNKSITKKEDNISNFKLKLSYELLKFDYITYDTLINDADYKRNLTNANSRINNYITELNNIISTPINTKEEFEKFYDHPALLNLEKITFDIYYFYLLKFNFNSEYSLCKIISTETDKLFKKIKEMAFKSINKTFILFQNYNDIYTVEERRVLAQEFDRNAPVQNTSLFFRSQQTVRAQEQRKHFKLLKESEAMSYTYITLYTRISTISLSRKLMMYSEEKNINNTKNKELNSFKKYYTLIKNNFTEINDNIPVSIFWENDNDIENIDLLIENYNMNINNLAYAKEDIQGNITDLEQQFRSEVDTIVPFISKIGIVKSCYKIIKPLLEITTNEQITKNFFLNLLRDDDETDICRIQLTRLAIDNADLDKVNLAQPRNTAIVNQQEYKTILNWEVDVFQYLELNEERTIFEPIVTALNGQLIKLQRITYNLYSLDSNDPIYKNYVNNQFSLQNIRKAIFDFIKKDIYQSRDLYINYYRELAQEFCEELLIPYMMLRSNTDVEKMYLLYMKEFIELKWEKIKFMFVNTNLDSLIQLANKKNLLQYNKLFNVMVPNEKYTIINIIDTFIVNNITFYKRIIGLGLEKQVYMGDEVILTLIEKIFKIKIFVIQTQQIKLRVGSLIQFTDDRNPGRPIEKEGFVKSILFNYQIDDIVIANYRNQGLWLKGTIIQIHRQGLYRVRYDDNQYGEENRLSENIQLFRMANIEYNYLNQLLFQKQIFYLSELKIIFKERFDLLNDDSKWNRRNTRPNNWVGLSNMYNVIINIITRLVNILYFMNYPLYIDFAIRGTELFEFIVDLLNRQNVIELVENILPHGSNYLTFIYNYFIGRVNGENNDLGLLEMVANYYPTLEIQDPNDFSTYSISILKMTNFVNPFYFIDFDPYNMTKFIRDDPNYTTRYSDYMFILSNNGNEYNTYSNIFSLSEKIFIYKYNEIPNYLNYLIFESFIKYSIENTHLANVLQNIMYFKNVEVLYENVLEQYYVRYTNLLGRYNPPVVPIQVNNAISINGLRKSTRSVRQTNIGNVSSMKGQKQNYGIKTTGGAKPQNNPYSFNNTNALTNRYVNVNQGNTIFDSNKDSRLSYYIIIDLELYPGEDGIPAGQKLVLGCQMKYEKIRQAWAKLFGLVYRPIELDVPGYVVPSPVKDDRRYDERRDDERRDDARSRDDRRYDRRDNRRDDRRYDTRKHDDRRNNNKTRRT